MNKPENKNVGVVLAGSGWQDGTEIHEAVLTLLYLDQASANIKMMAPTGKQMHVIHHLTGKPITGENREILCESARIARGDIEEINNISADTLDSLIIPGGFGAAKNLSDFATKGEKIKVIPELKKLLQKLYNQKKPMGFICIAPVIAAKVLGEFNPRITIGTDKETANILEKLGAKHINCTVDNIVIDEKNKIVTTPAYMLGPSISMVAKGIKKLVNKVIEMS